MKHKKIDENNFILRLEKGDKIIESIQKFCNENNIELGYFHGIGAASKIELAHYRVDNKKYSSKIIDEPLEVISLHGNITTMNNEVYLHSHIVAGNDKMQAFGGHLKEATISATAEIFVVSIKGKVKRKYNEEIGINLMDF